MSLRDPKRSVWHEHGLSTLEFALIFVLIVVGALLMWRKLGGSLETQLDTGTGRFDETLAGARDGTLAAPSGSANSAHSVTAAPGAASDHASSNAARRNSAHSVTAMPSAASDHASTDAARPNSSPGQAVVPAAGTDTSTPAANPNTSAGRPTSTGSAAPSGGASQPEPSWWERTRDSVVSSTPVQMGLGIAYGTVQALAPGGFLMPSPNASSRPFEYGRGAGETATGIVQLVSGVGMLGGGGTSAAAGVAGAPVSGGGSLLLTGGGLAVAAEGVATIAQGVSNVAAGIGTLSNAMSMQGPGDGSHSSGGGDGGAGSDGPTRPSRKPDPDAQPEGKPAKLGSEDPEVQRSLTRENDSARVLAQAGYKVRQHPPDVPGPRNPDYIIEGRIFDNYAPSTNKPRAIWTVINNTKVNPVDKARQADRIILNLTDSSVELAALKKQFTDWPIEGLKEVIIIKGGQIIPFWP